MMRLAEAILFLSLAAAAHAGVWVLAPGVSGAQSSGDAGSDTVSLSPASPAQVAMLERWSTAPVIPADLPQTPMQAVPAMMPPSLPEGTAPAPAQSKTPKAMPLQRTDAIPRADTQTAKAPEPPQKPKVRPKLRPKTAQKGLQTASLAQPEKRASGAGSAAQQGVAGRDQTGSQDTQRRNALKAAWGAQIHAKIRRNMLYPRGTTSTGTTKLALRVASNGRLQTLNVLRSSGDARLDAAALRAVKKAGRFAKAPPELSDQEHAFSLSLTFNR